MKGIDHFMAPPTSTFKMCDWVGPRCLEELGSVFYPARVHDGCCCCVLDQEQLVAHSRGYTQESALSRRVKDWEDQVGPELLLQEQRPPFSIREYGDRITGALSGVGCCRTFSSIVQGQDNLEVCKFLLASLQLANDYTVEIQSSAGLEESLDTMSLTLLSTHRATDRFQNLQASS